MFKLRVRDGARLVLRVEIQIVRPVVDCGPPKHEQTWNGLPHGQMDLEVLDQNNGESVDLICNPQPTDSNSWSIIVALPVFLLQSRSSSVSGFTPALSSCGRSVRSREARFSWSDSIDGLHPDFASEAGVWTRLPGDSSENFLDFFMRTKGRHLRS